MGPLGWALVSLFSTYAFEYDRQTYPDRDLVVLVDGTSSAAKLKLLDGLPLCALVVKTYDETVKAYFERQRAARLFRSFLSFTASDSIHLPLADSEVRQGTALPTDVARMFAENGYLDNEIARYFSDGARWFSIMDGERARSAGFVFRNFEAVWEIGGIFTDPEARRKGLARRIVETALRFLMEQGRIPRYQVRSDNVASIGLAEASGLRQFLKMDHLVVDG